MKETSQSEILEQRKKRIFSLRSFVLLVLCVSIVAFLFSIFDIESFKDIITKTDPVYLLAGSFCYLLSNFFKTLRFLVFFNDEKMNLPSLFTVVSYHNFFNQIMPARTGELTLVYYLKKILNMDMSRGVHSLLVARFLDLFIVALFFVVSFLITASENVSIYLFAGAIGVGVAALVVILFIAQFMKIAAQSFDFISRKTGLQKFGFIAKLRDKLHELAETFGKEGIVHKMPLLILTSILTWGALYTLSWCIIMAFTNDLSYFQSVLGSTAAVLTNVLPINSFGSFGTLEAGWVGGYYLVGLGKNVAIMSAFAYHLVVFLSSAVISIICLSFLTLSKKRSSKQK